MPGDGDMVETFVSGDVSWDLHFAGAHACCKGKEMFKGLGISGQLFASSIIVFLTSFGVFHHFRL
jgi:hypothetical protein